MALAADELREMSEDELRDKESELKRTLFNLRFQLSMGQQDNTAALKETRRDIARVKTVLSERRKAIADAG
ncbi:MAG: 50S ribosomal protein L29 [Candidatus Bipolaricaulia bacterium]